jgi:hypothetical protein
MPTHPPRASLSIAMRAHLHEQEALA